MKSRVGSLTFELKLRFQQISHILKTCLTLTLSKKNSRLYRAPQFEAIEPRLSPSRFLLFFCFQLSLMCFFSVSLRWRFLIRLVFHFWRCLCMQLFDDRFWILSREEEKCGEEKKKEAKHSWSTTIEAHLLSLLISFHCSSTYSMWFMRYVYGQKRNFTITGCDFFELHFFSSFIWRVLPFNVS